MFKIIRNVKAVSSHWPIWILAKSRSIHISRFRVFSVITNVHRPSQIRYKKLFVMWKRLISVRSFSTVVNCITIVWRKSSSSTNSMGLIKIVFTNFFFYFLTVFFKLVDSELILKWYTELESEAILNSFADLKNIYIFQINLAFKTLLKYIVFCIDILLIYRKSFVNNNNFLQPILMSTIAKIKYKEFFWII